MITLGAQNESCFPLLTDAPVKKRIDIYAVMISLTASHICDLGHSRSARLGLHSLQSA
jgi:hypothetical protein